MSKKRQKKVNPRRIPMAKAMFDREQILEEATKDDLYRAWLLTFNALMEQERIEKTEAPTLTDAVNNYIKGSTFQGSSRSGEIRRAEAIMGFSTPYDNLHPEQVKSEVQLSRFKKKVFQVATHTALCVICLGLASSGRFSDSDLRQIFFHVDLTLSEIEHGSNSYAELERNLDKYGLTIERESDDYHHVSVTE